MKYPHLVFVGLMFMTLVATAQTVPPELRIVDVRLAGNVVDREPQNEFGPKEGCSIEGNPASIPVINPNSYPTVYLWTKIDSTSEFVINHTYYKDGNQFRVKETITPVLDRIRRAVREISIGLGWKRFATVELLIGLSPTWRTWSSKELDPIVHKGEWRVEVKSRGNAEAVLCTVYFVVE